VAWSFFFSTLAQARIAAKAQAFGLITERQR